MVLILLNGMVETSLVEFLQMAYTFTRLMQRIIWIKFHTLEDVQYLNRKMSYSCLHHR